MSGIVKGMHIRDEPVRRFGEVQSSVRTGRIRDCCVVGFKGPLFAFFLVVLFLGSVALPSLVRPAAIPNPSIADTAPPPSAVEAGIRDGYGKLPLSFEANQGQTDPQVKFLARGPGYTLFLTTDGAVFSLSNVKGLGRGEFNRLDSGDQGPTSRAVVHMQLVGANVSPRVSGVQKLEGRANYFIGNDPALWHSDIPTYARVLYRDVYPGIDLAYYGDQGRIEYDFAVAAGADPGVIALRFNGADSTGLDAQGRLLLQIAGDVIAQPKPLVYQENGGVRMEVSGGYSIDAGGDVRFSMGAYDASRLLVIDPVIYSTYLGGSSDDYSYGIAVDSAGNAYLTGYTYSADFPTPTGAFDTTFNGLDDAFVTKLNPAGSALVYSTYLGGGGYDQGYKLAVDSAGSAYVTGITGSTNFPTTVGAFDTTANGNYDAFVTKLNAFGSALVYSTYLGGGGYDQGDDIGVDSTGSAYVSGFTDSMLFPTTAGAFDTTFNGLVDTFVTKLNPAGSALGYSTYLGGSDEDRGYGIAVDSVGSAYVTGYTYSADFPTTAGALDATYNGNYDAFVTKLNAFGSALVYSTYLGGSSYDFGFGIAVDSTGSAYVTGYTYYVGAFPTTAGAFDTTANGNYDAFVTKLNAFGSALVYSTYLGGSGDDYGFGIAVDSAGSAYVTGSTYSADFPTTAGAFDTTYNGGYDAFVTKLNAFGSALVYSTYLGGNTDDYGYGIAVDSAGNAYVTGFTHSADFPTTGGAFDTTTNGGWDAFVTKLDLVHAPVPTTLVLSPTTATNPVGTQHCVTATVRDQFGNPVSGVTARFSVPTSGATHASPSSGAAVTDTNGQATFCYSASVPGVDTIHAFADVNANQVQDQGEPFGDATKVWTAGRPATLTLEPKTATNTVGTSHTITATVTDSFGNPTPGVTVVFSVTGANPVSGTCKTDVNGKCTFAYLGVRAGTDAIHAFADTNENGIQDGGEPFGDATKIWTAGRPAKLTLSPSTDTNTVGASHTVTATVTDSFGNPTPGITVQFSVSGANQAGGKCTTDINGQCTFAYTGTHAGTDAIHAFADTNSDGVQNQDEPFGDATKIWIAGPPFKLTLSPSTATNTVGTPHTVTATVTDSYGNPNPGITVQFSVSGANTASDVCLTDLNGKCSFTYTGTRAGTDMIHAFADTNRDGRQDQGEPFGDASKIWIAGRPAKLTLSPSADSNTVGTSHTVTATVTDAFGNPTPGIVVRFSVSGPNQAGDKCPTDINGQCSFTYTGTHAGMDTIHGYADTNDNGVEDQGEPSGDATKLWIAGPPATLTLEPKTATNTVGSPHVVTATVKDSFGNPAPGRPVRFSITGANTLTDYCLADLNGKCNIGYIGFRAGTDTIYGYVDTNNNGVQDQGEPSDTATKIWTPGPPRTLVLTPATASNTVGTPHTVTATVSDTYGNPVPNVVVRFTVTGANSASGSMATGADGKATFTYTGTNTGTDTITAYADTNNNNARDIGEPFNTATKEWTPGPPATLTLAPKTASNPVGTQHTVTATVTDAYGNPTPGITVRFSVSGANSATGTDVTDANGKAIFSYIGTHAGTDTITAYADTNNNNVKDAGEPSDTASKTWTPGPPATVVLAPPSATNTVGTPHTVTATVRDAFFNPVPNVMVRFTVTGANPLGGVCTTSTNGQCSFTYTGTHAGTDTISAFADTNANGIQDPSEPFGEASKIWTPGPPAKLTLAPKTATNTVGTTHAVTATVTDSYGNPTPGITVQFSVSGANPATGSSVTGADGKATFTYPGTHAGTDTISAFADTNHNTAQDVGEPGDTATKTWTAGPPVTLVLTPTTATNLVGTTHCVTATVKDRFGNPISGVTVRFSVPTSVATHASLSSGSAVTNAQGQATFCYSASLPGTDAIHAFADTNSNGNEDVGEPFGDASKIWTLPLSTAFCEVTITNGGWITAINGDKATFGGNAKVAGDGLTVSGQEQYQDQGPARPLNVHSIELLAATCSDDLKTATIYGTTTIDGSGTYVFRIDVVDTSKSGADDEYGIILSNGYVSGLQKLQGGNVQIHKVSSTRPMSLGDFGQAMGFALKPPTINTRESPTQSL